MLTGYTSLVSIRHSTIASNSSAYSGGGIGHAIGQLTISHSIVADNVAPTDSDITQASEGPPPGESLPDWRPSNVANGRRAQRATPRVPIAGLPPDGISLDFSLVESLGATTVVPRSEFPLGSRALEPARFAGAIDNVGGEMLAGLTRQVDFWGCIASVGLAGGAELRTTVMPFILRGVNLLGINSSATRREERLEVWQRIASDLTPRHIERIVTRVIPFDELPGAFQAHMEGKITGRTVVKIR